MTEMKQPQSLPSGTMRLQGRKYKQARGFSRTKSGTRLREQQMPTKETAEGDEDQKQRRMDIGQYFE
jgi:hypothetical protein